ncbi:type II toxin-antitoxin system RelE/ParE family toxin [Sphingobacterium sp. DN00404]|uniref:Type II toxin-antitoxin system RelE/ParE family toxin n=1 Tax=Sphingobacterium micropteri TaxID=2763501 RepID=A0ABR7YRK6_9SPHI|nr:type II toxin-antitoxin system RelE/ParE family toxin [Sphingobacterium micropteri]MBD1433924.1 type II toxin-antitoxin system RelE/ParE family toxin [Sphingobacterium micropteri]
MAYKLVIKSLAENDIQQAIEWYLENSPPYASALLKKIDQTLQRIKQNPQHYQKRYKKLQLALTDKFPYGLYYTTEGDTVYVHAVLHTKQNPEQGVKRV